MSKESGAIQLPTFDRPRYRHRNIIERMLGWLKESRRIVTRFDKLAKVMAPWFRWLVSCGVCDGFFQTEPSGVTKASRAG